ncbi:MAG: DNA-binding response regulator [Nitrosomonadales bacterium SCN 54-20]|nr:MAG: DNA-binding response regulator [Nitrosomonadales bacterium SCN 54-20]
MPELIANVVLIEDEQQIRRFVRIALEREGFHVHESETGERGLIEIGTRKPDAVILDLGLPDMDGIEVIKEVRNWSTVPIIILSSRTDEYEKVRGLDAGADDYLVKPFGVPELLARLRAHLRRRSLASDERGSDGTYRLEDITVNLPKRLVTRGSEQIHLTPIEFRLLAVLIRNSGRVVTQRQLLKEVWGPAYLESNHYLRIYMGHLRQKLEVDPAQPKHLITETGVGYRLVLE